MIIPGGIEVTWVFTLIRLILEAKFGDDLQVHSIGATFSLKEMYSCMKKLFTFFPCSPRVLTRNVMGT